MKKPNKTVITQNIQKLENTIDELLKSNLPQNSKKLLENIKLSLLFSPRYIKDHRCRPFDSNLGEVLDNIVDFANKNKITIGAKKEFKILVELHCTLEFQSNSNKDKQFMSAKKLLTHIKNFKNLIISTNKKSNNSTSSSSSEVPKEQMISPDVLIEYLDIVIDLLKVEKYRLTDKATSRDSEPGYKMEFRTQKQVTTNPVSEQLIQYILSDNFQPKESDIKQGAIGDCYLLAALKNIARENPKAIKKCFVASKRDGLIVRFYKVLVETEFIEEKNKIKITTKANGRIMIKMDKSVFAREGFLVGNNANCIESLWVNLMEKAYSIYLRNFNIKDKDDNYRKIIGTGIFNEDLYNSSSIMEGGSHPIAITAITGKQGFGIFNSVTIRNTDNSGNPTTPQLQSSKIDPSTILGIIEEALKEGKSVIAGTFLEYHNCWNTPVKFENRYLSYNELTSVFCPDHAYSVKGIEEVSGNKYIVLSNPHMYFDGIMITGDVVSYYGNTGDVYLIPENFSKYIRNYGINKLKRQER